MQSSWTPWLLILGHRYSQIANRIESSISHRTRLFPFFFSHLSFVCRRKTTKEKGICKSFSNNIYSYSMTHFIPDVHLTDITYRILKLKLSNMNFKYITCKWYTAVWWKYMYTVNYKNFCTQFKAVKSNWNFVLNEIFRVCACLKCTNTQFHLKKNL